MVEVGSKLQESWWAQFQAYELWKALGHPTGDSSSTYLITCEGTQDIGSHLGANDISVAGIDEVQLEGIEFSF